MLNSVWPLLWDHSKFTLSYGKLLWTDPESYNIISNLVELSWSPAQLMLSSFWPEVEIDLNSRWRVCYVDLHLYISLSSDNNGKSYCPCYAFTTKPLNARPVDAKRCRSGRALAERKPLTGRDGETKKRKRKKSSKRCAGPGFPKPANFLGEIVFFC